MDKTHWISFGVGIPLFLLLVLIVTPFPFGGDEYVSEIDSSPLTEKECVADDLFWNDTGMSCDLDPDYMQEEAFFKDKDSK